MITYYFIMIYYINNFDKLIKLFGRNYKERYNGRHTRIHDVYPLAIFQNMCLPIKKKYKVLEYMSVYPCESNFSFNDL